MKKKLTRVLAFALIAMMLIPAFSALAVSAEEAIDISDIVNVYELNQLNASPNEEKVNGAKDKDPTPEDGVLASKAFATSRNGDKYIYIGPCPDPANYTDGDKYNYPIVYWYNKDGKYTAFKKMGELQDNVVDRFPDGSVILKVMVGTNYKYAAIKVPTTYADCMLITCERPFTVEEYYAYADTQGWAIDGTLRPIPPATAEEAPEGYEGLWNLFPRLGEYDATLTQQEVANEYQMSAYIPVNEGDVITMGAIKSKETRSILYTYSDELLISDYTEIRQYKRTDVNVNLVENLDQDFAIYSFEVPEGVSYVRVRARLGVYNNGDTFVTRNQPFTGAQMREALEIAEASKEVKAHPFYGKNALFVGDSIGYGSYDTPSAYSVPSTSFARRLANATGLIPTNISYPGATVAQTGSKTSKWEYDLLKTALITKKNYDMVVFQGGIVDALNTVPVGEALAANTDRDVLLESDRLATFAGGLQLMFHDAKIKWQGAELYYIANYKVTDAATNGVDMTEYYAQAKALCAAYGVHYIDLYNNEELYKTFDYTNAELFAEDLYTPTNAAYDLLFPTVLRLFNESLTSDVTNTLSSFGSAQPNATTSNQIAITESTKQAQTTETIGASCEDDHNCEGAPMWLTLLNSIINFFRRLFGLPELCTCGEVITKVK